MKRSIITIVLVLAVSFLIFGQAKKQTQPTSAEQELIQLEKDWMDAGIKRDIAFLDRVEADDCIATDEEGNLHNKAEHLANVKSGTQTVTSIVIDDIKAHVWGDAGVAWVRWTEKSQLKGKDTSGQYQETDSWIKISGRWQCVAVHWSKVVKK
jgi:hypothetical protein